MKSFCPRSDDELPKKGGSNPEVDFPGQKRSNQTHVSLRWLEVSPSDAFRQRQNLLRGHRYGKSTGWLMARRFSPSHKGY